jgi:putative tricarboxylic transport membrane protein
MRRADLAIGLGVVALGAVLFAGTGEIGAGAGFDRIGPRVVPYVVAAGLVGLGLVLAAGGIFRRRVEPAGVEALDETKALQWMPLAYMGVALILPLFVFERAGFVLASWLQFVIVARAFHSRRPARDGVVGLLLSVVTHLAFARGLGLNLPPGILEGLL